MANLAKVKVRTKPPTVLSETAVAALSRRGEKFAPVYPTAVGEED